MILQGIAYVNNATLTRVSIVINEETGRIEDIKVGYSARRGSGEVIDVTRERFRILPGFIDMHVHLRDLRYSYKEDYFTGTAAAARGGVVLVCDMPNTDPPTNTLSNLMLKIEAARGKAVTDYGVYYGAPVRSGELPDVAKYVVGFKLYPEDVFNHLDLSTYAKVLKVAASSGLPILFHAEDPRIFASDVPPGMERPAEAEYSGVNYVVNLTRDLATRVVSGTEVKVHVTHVSSIKALRLIRSLKEELRGVIKLSLDITPHHLLLDNSLYRLNAGLHKVYPTLKTKFDNLGLYLALLRGDVDAIASDHAPHTLNEKLRPYEEACPGYPGLETTASILLTMVSKGLLALEDVPRYYSYGPAKVLGLYPHFGVLRKGAYASLTVVDLKAEWVVRAEEFMSKAKYSPFDRWVLRGRPYLTMVRGKVVYWENELRDDLRGWGVNVRELSEVKSSN